MTERIIETKCGKIRGYLEDGILSFLGIRYATAERFEYPKETEHWDGIYDAFTFGNCSYQPRAFRDESTIPEKQFYFHEFRENEHYTYSEDCLFLNIWVPEHANNAPVLLYVHGGSFISGCGHEKPFKNPVWPKKGVIAVTINYRLGPLGFACFPEFKSEYGHTGNYALYDQLAAIQWVSHNIRAFGGDPKNITVMGQSAGAMSLQTLCMSPKTNGLISRAVLCSGGGLGRLFASRRRIEECYPYWKEVSEEAKAANTSDLKTMPVQQLFQAWEKVDKRRKDGWKILYPGIDGDLVPVSARASARTGSFPPIPYMLCTTGDDLLPPILHHMAARWLTVLSKKQIPGYCCFFDRSLPGDGKGSWHSSDLWYWFGTFQNSWRPFTTLDQKLSNTMTGYLCNFCYNGNPNGDNLPIWNTYTSHRRDAIIFDDEGVQKGKVNRRNLWRNMILHR